MGDRGFQRGDVVLLVFGVQGLQARHHSLGISDAMFLKKAAADVLRETAQNLLDRRILHLEPLVQQGLSCVTIAMVKYHVLDRQLGMLAKLNLIQLPVLRSLLDNFVADLVRETR